MGIKLIATDLDGTLLGSNNYLSPRNLESLKEASRRGIRIALCTGRAYRGSLMFAKQIAEDCIIVASNGALIRQGQTQLRERAMDSAACSRAIKLAKKMGLHFHVYAADEIVTENLIQSTLWYDSWNKSLPERDRFVISVVPDAEKYIEEKRLPILKLFADASDDQIDLLNRYKRKIRRARGIATSSSYPDNVEVFDKNVDKGEALAWLAARLGIAPSEVMAIGDNENDIGMLRYAGVSVAMANAIPQARRAARFYTASNEHDGLAIAVENHALGK